MSVSTKRKSEDKKDEQYHEHLDRKPRLETERKLAFEDNDDTISNFISWCHEHDFQLSSKVKVTRKGSCAQWGMQATDDIVEGYCLFQIPRASLLLPANSDVTDLIDIDDPQWTSSNQWIPLLLTLLYERNKPQSKWEAYLKLTPHPQAIDLPMFWSQSEIDRLLKGTGVEKAVARDLDKIEADFNNLVLPFQQKAKEKIRTDAINLSSFKRMVAFVMAYSFTEPAVREDEDDDNDDEDVESSETLQPPMMVPMADLLNHITKHNAKLTFGSHALKMVTTRAINKGEEIFNTYGQVSNLHLMHMYGFAEQYPHNTNDVVEIPIIRLLEAAKHITSELGTSNSPLLQSKWDHLSKQEIIDEDDVVVLGREGILNDDICTQVLKVLCMSSSEFAEYVDKEGWSDAESGSSDTQTNMLDLSFLRNLDKKQRMILQRMCHLHLENYAMSFEEAEKNMEKATNLPARERFALFTVHGQQMLIRQFIDACSC